MVEAASKKKLLEKIKALLSKTTENGCTEAEMMAALDKARELMAEYDISETDLAFNAEEVVREDAAISFGGMWIAVGVAQFCEVEDYRSGRRSESRINFVGLQSDVIFAFWLLSALENFVERETEKFVASSIFADGHERNKKRRSFILGCAGRIQSRLIELAKQRRADRPRSASGRDLVVTKQGLIKRKLNELGIRFQSGGRAGAGDIESFRAGASVGDRATFDKPVNAGGGVLRIGSR